MDLAKLRELFPAVADWHEHPNGGGWVADTAKVELTAHVGPDALVYGEARVLDGAQIRGAARVYGKARVYEHAHVYDEASVYDDARVLDDARVYGNASVYGRSHVSGRAHVYGWAMIFDQARVYGQAHVYGEAQVYGRSFVNGLARLFNIAEVHGASSVNGGQWDRSPIQIQGSRDFVCEGSDTIIRIGCVRGTPEWWAKYVVVTGQDHGYSQTEIEEYQLYLELIAKVRARRWPLMTGDVVAQATLPAGVIGDTIRAGE